MKNGTLLPLAAFAAAEFIVIIFLAVNYIRVDFKAVQSPVPKITSPLETALEFESSARKFEEIVKNYPEWINYQPKTQSKSSWPILAKCAILLETNYVKFLINNNADAALALSCLNEVGAQDAINLVRSINQ